MEMGERAVREEEGTRVLPQVVIGEADPVEGKVVVGMGARFEQAAHGTEEEGACEELDVEAPAAAFGIVLGEE